MAEYTAHYNVLHTDCRVREKISDLDDTHPGILGAKLIHLRSSKVHQDIFEDNLGIWIQSYVKPWTRPIKSEEPQDRRRHVILCIFIIVIIHMRIRGKCVLRSDIS